MTATVDPRVDADNAPPPSDLPAPTPPSGASPQEAGGEDLEQGLGSPLRIAVSLALPTLAAAILVGGVFAGLSPRFYAGCAGLFGIALAVGASRIRRPIAALAAVAGGLFAIGLLMMVPTGPADIVNVRGLVTEAASAGSVLRPPVPLTPGWQALIGWVMGTVGFTAGWVALVLRRPSIALLLPLPVAGIGAISTPSEAQVASGIAAVVLFALGLGLLASSQSLGDGEERPPLGYEVRKALRSLPLLVAITAALVVLAQADFLFPEPYINPAEEPQRPKTQPLSDVQDRVLFTVEAEISGPWRTGSLDVYDGKDWRLPPFAENELDEVPRSGIVDPELTPGVRARFTIAGLTGAVLPGLPNIHGIVAEGPRLAYDARNGNIRVDQGQVQAGLAYTVTAAALPTVEDLMAITAPIPKDMQRFAEIPVDPPPAAADLIRQAPNASLWERFDFLRTHILDNVVATGTGVPKSITPEIVQDMLAGSKEASPFEIVAAQAMFARWIGLPSRIGYGYDGGDLVEGKLEVRPTNGATFVEVWFPGYKWLPVVGTPRQAKPTVGGDPGEQRLDPNVLPSEDVAIQLYLPVVVDPPSVLVDQIRQAVLLALPIVLLLVLLYVLWPAARKAWTRSRRRSAAMAEGPRARVALAYAEWRDYATDFGFRHPTDTPLMFLDRFSPDQEHSELAWLVTRGLWGDLQHDLTVEHAAAAEELSRALRRRLAQAQPHTMRWVAAVSRLSLREPYAPETDLTPRAVVRREKEEADVLASA